MSADATGHVIRWSPHTGADYITLLMIADSVNDTFGNEFYMSINNLATKARLSKSSVSTAVKNLVETGWIRVLRGAKDADGRPTGRPAKYLFLFPGSGVPVYETRRQREERESRGETDHRSGDGASDDAISQEDPNLENDSRCTPSASNPAGDDDLIRRFTELLRSEGAEMLALKAVDGDEDAIEMLELARMIVNARALPMKDRPEAEQFEDTPAYRLCVYLVDAMMEADPEMKRPKITRTWVQEAGRMLNPKLDNRQPGEIRAIIHWIFRSTDPKGNWWQGNVQSMRKFRAQFDQLRQKKAEAERGQQTRTASRGVQQQPQGAPVQFGTDGKVTEAYVAWEHENLRAIKADMIAEIGEAGIEEARAAGRLPGWWDDV